MTASRDLPGLPVLLRPTEAAAYLGVHRDTLRRLVRDDGLPTIRVGARTRVAADALGRWVEAHERVAK